MRQVTHPDGWPDIWTVARDAGVSRQYVRRRMDNIEAVRYCGMWFIEPNAAWDLVRWCRQNLFRVREKPR